MLVFGGTDYEKRDFENWSNNNYIPGIKKLVKYWVNHMISDNEVLKIYPFLGLQILFYLAKKKVFFDVVADG